MKLPLYFYETKVVGVHSIRDGDNVRIAENLDESTARGIVDAVNAHPYLSANNDRLQQELGCAISNFDEMKFDNEQLAARIAVMIDALQLVREHAPIGGPNIRDAKHLDTVVDYALSVGRTI